MVGFIIVTHNNFGKEILQTVEEIIKEKPNILAIGIEPGHDFSESQKRIHEAIDSFKDKEGVIILTDLYGATPSNLCKEYLINGKIEMITGCNLPVVLKVATTEFKESPSQIAQFLKNYGKDNIRVYSTDY